MDGIRRIACAVVPVLLLAGCGAAGEESEVYATGASASLLTLAEDSASNPTVAHDARTGASYLAWVGREAGENAVFLRVVDADGDARPPVRVNDIPGDAAPHLQAPAQVAAGPEGNVYVVWQNNTPIEGRRFPASDLRMAVSTDGGRSFQPAITVNDDAGDPYPSSHTFHDIAVAADGTVYVSWIDSRERDAILHQQRPLGGGSAQGEHDHLHGDPAGDHVPASHDHSEVALPDGPEIRVARSSDGGRSFAPSMVVDTDACPCCRTSLALGPDGTVYVAWRKLFAGDVRDIVVARAAPGATEFDKPVRVHADDWVFPACPHAGPSLAVDDAGRLLVGWYTGKEGRQGLWYAASEDGGRSFAAPAAVLHGDWVPPAQLRLATSGDVVWAVWDDHTREMPQVRAAVGRVGGPLRPHPGWVFAGSDPALVATDAGARISWLNESAAMTAALAGEG